METTFCKVLFLSLKNFRQKLVTNVLECVPDKNDHKWLSFINFCAGVIFYLYIYFCFVIKSSGWKYFIFSVSAYEFLR